MIAKIVFLGPCNAGKTSIISSYLCDKRNNQNVTIPATYFTKKCKIGKFDATIGIWDTAGSEKYKSIVPMYFRDADVGIVVIDSSLPDSDDNAIFWINELKTKGKPNVNLIIAMNKVDILSQNREPIFKRGENFVKDFGGKLILTSARTGEGINQLFETAYSIIEKVFKERENEEKMVRLKENTDSSECC